MYLIFKTLGKNIVSRFGDVFGNVFGDAFGDANW